MLELQCQPLQQPQEWQPPPSRQRQRIPPNTQQRKLSPLVDSWRTLAMAAMEWLEDLSELQLCRALESVPTWPAYARDPRQLPSTRGLPPHVMQALRQTPGPSSRWLATSCLNRYIPQLMLWLHQHMPQLMLSLHQHMAPLPGPVLWLHQHMAPL